jgi:predicted transcriptional regulator with HTH domain
MGLRKKKSNTGFKLYELTEEEIYKIMPKLKKRGLDKITDNDKRLYYLRVWLITEIQPLHKLPNYNKRCWDRVGCYELDHILSISYSYLEGIPPHKVGSLENLRFIPKKENRSKSFKLTEDSHKVLRKFKQERDIYKKRNKK